MGYARYTITRQNGETIDAGYDVEAICEEPNCGEQIDRGIAYLCGSEPGDPEYGCGGYFCGQHLYGVPEGEPGESRCGKCLASAECPACGSPADKTGYHIPEHRTGCPYIADDRAI